ncbi:MAG TPA: flotillin [Myxococcales bacterium]|nr:flotillin [Myxococcales bacterium]
MLIKTFIVICPPNQVLVISGRRKGGELSNQGYRLVFGGRDYRIPIFEQVERLDLTTIPINISVKNAYSKGGIALHVQAVANIKISSSPVLVKNAIERFMGRERGDIIRVAKDTLEGNLREVLATLTPEQVNEDRLRFAESLAEIAEDDLKQLGLHLDTLKIQHVEDSDNYLNSIGRQRIAQIIRDAEIAESNARREAEEVAAQKLAEAKVVEESAAADVAKSRNELREFKAELDAKARSEEEKTTAAALEARAIAEQELQTIRTTLEQLRLQADKVIPAEAMKQAREMQAKATAAPIAENGKALAAALNKIAESWSNAGDDARDIFLIQQLEKILAIVVSTVNDMQVGNVHLIDSGDGKAIPNYVRSFPATVEAILESLAKTTGIDVTGILAESSKLTTSASKE